MLTLTRRLRPLLVVSVNGTLHPIILLLLLLLLLNPKSILFPIHSWPQKPVDIVFPPKRSWPDLNVHKMRSRDDVTVLKAAADENLINSFLFLFFFFSSGQLNKKKQLFFLRGAAADSASTSANISFHCASTSFWAAFIHVAASWENLSSCEEARPCLWLPRSLSCFCALCLFCFFSFFICILFHL